MLNRILLGVAAGMLACGCGSSGESSGGGPQKNELSVTLTAEYDAYPHADAFSGQTATGVSAGVRSFELLGEAGETWQLHDAAPGNLAVSYEAGATNQLAVLAPAQVPGGHYTKARLVQDWSRFDVSATLHETGLVQPGTLHALQVTTDGAEVDGKTHDRGYYEQTFVGGSVERPYSGKALIPDHSTTAEAEALVENGEWAVYFPVSLDVAAGATGTLAIRLNLDRAFRWSELDGDGYAEGTYDIEPPIYEPVEQFGGNRFDVALE